jgi:hypothetical protein
VTTRAAKPKPESEAAKVPCVRCRVTPTVGFSYEPRDRYHGRVCATHAQEAVARGAGVALDEGGVRNWAL